jgi:phenylpyruvate tautomerase PptA (4-oxalocrotonate tautomerase family)
MPLLTFSTNLNITADQTSVLPVKLSSAASRLLGKPESYVMVMINGNQTMLMGGSDEPCAFLQLKSLGLPEEDCAAFSAALCDEISDELSIAPNRIYIEFSNPARHLWGWDRGTFG